MAKHRRGRVLLRRNRAFDTRLAALRIGLKKRARGIEIRILARSRGRCTVDLRKIEVTHGMGGCRAVIDGCAALGTDGHAIGQKRPAYGTPHTARDGDPLRETQLEVTARTLEGAIRNGSSTVGTFHVRHLPSDLAATSTIVGRHSSRGFQGRRAGCRPSRGKHLPWACPRERRSRTRPPRQRVS